MGRWDDLRKWVSLQLLGRSHAVKTKAIIKPAPTSRASIPNKCREIATVLNARDTLANFVESAVMGENRGGG